MLLCHLTGRGSTPSRPGQGGGTPSSPGLGGVPHADLNGGGGTPSSPGWGGTPSSTNRGDTPSSFGWGLPHPDLGRGYPPCPDLGMGYPPPTRPDLGWGTPSHKCGRTDTCENITSSHPSDAGGNKVSHGDSELANTRILQKRGIFLKRPNISTATHPLESLKLK